MRFFRMKMIALFFLMLAGLLYGQNETSSREDSCILSMPKVFTPNGDSFNDCVRASYSCPFDSLRLSIFDRWGELMFTSITAEKARSSISMQESYSTDCWDGTRKEQAARSGTYLWWIEININEEKLNYQGELVLLH